MDIKPDIWMQTHVPGNQTTESGSYFPLAKGTGLRQGLFLERRGWIWREEELRAWWAGAGPGQLN